MSSVSSSALHQPMSGPNDAAMIHYKLDQSKQKFKTSKNFKDLSTAHGSYPGIIVDSTFREMVDRMYSLPHAQLKNFKVPSQLDILNFVQSKIAKYVESISLYVDCLIANESRDLQNKKLYVVQLGGRIEGGTTEIHDIAFGIGRCIQEAYPYFIKKWIGTKSNVHIDSIVEVDHIQGYKVRILDRPHAHSQMNLFLINSGCYFKNVLGEFHRFCLVVAPKEGNAIAKAKEIYLKALKDRPLQAEMRDIEQPHLDDAFLLDKDPAFDVDDILSIADVGQYYIALEKTGQKTEDVLKVENRYHPIKLLARKPEDKEYRPEDYCAEGQKSKLRSIRANWLEYINRLENVTPEEISQMKYVPMPIRSAL